MYLPQAGMTVREERGTCHSRHLSFRVHVAGSILENVPGQAKGRGRIWMRWSATALRSAELHSTVRTKIQMHTVRTLTKP